MTIEKTVIIEATIVTAGEVQGLPLCSRKCPHHDEEHYCGLFGSLSILCYSEAIHTLRPVGCLRLEAGLPSSNEYKSAYACMCSGGLMMRESWRGSAEKSRGIRRMKDGAFVTVSTGDVYAMTADDRLATDWRSAGWE